MSIGKFDKEVLYVSLEDAFQEMPPGIVLVSGVLRGGWAEIGSATVHWPTAFSLNLTVAVLRDAQTSSTGRPQ